ncbi:GRAS domain-containing protein [Forsythia ovata]|uniref:GRAS domain-containing protein n=1 Tax=Forsythia ovata TaxID=205694 RepID=A0ABD1SNV0_9LAMI
MDKWESLWSESVAASPSQEQSILRWILGEVEDPSMGSLNKVLQIGSDPPLAAAPNFEFNGGFWCCGSNIWNIISWPIWWKFYLPSSHLYAQFKFHHEQIRQPIFKSA